MTLLVVIIRVWIKRVGGGAGKQEERRVGESLQGVGSRGFMVFASNRGYVDATFAQSKHSFAELKCPKGVLFVQYVQGH